MEFQELGEAERKLLLTALDVSLQNIICKYCKEPVNYKNCSILPSKEGKPIIPASDWEYMRGKTNEWD